MAGTTVPANSAVVHAVETNNVAGYLVTVQGHTANLASGPENADPVPIGALAVRGPGTAQFTPLNSARPVTVYSTPVPSAEGGDELRDDYRIGVPFVAGNTYSATLDYVASAL
ncbi:hypothetical protein BU204_23250 [Actinophytocola xanthii]|uniref:Uncharacterized protein n=2 Tax=Actinophytocola xanthii TaxID=1912961 RepID=A0A1Q8CLI2_9PSEU|nr:hypothetical protein BU204_23250 [Actinophytocola xanthii]